MSSSKLNPVSWSQMIGFILATFSSLDGINILCCSTFYKMRAKNFMCVIKGFSESEWTVEEEQVTAFMLGEAR